MDESGLCALWIECDVLGVNTAQKVMAGKGYVRSMRTHELTLQALWKILLPRLNDHLDSVDEELLTELASIGTPSDTDDIAQIVEKLMSGRFRQSMIDFVKLLKDNPNAEFS